MRVMEVLNGGNDTALAQELVKKCDTALVAEYNNAIEEQIVALYHFLADLPAYAKDVVNAYIIAGEGQKLLNNLLPVLHCRLYGGTEPARVSSMKLAEDLEKWLADYHGLWKTVSKESEFYRIADVYYWYADYLRALES